MKNNYNKYFKLFLNKNKSFYEDIERPNRTLIVSVTNDLIFNTILLKFGKVISEIENSNIIFFPFLKHNKEINKLAKSFKVLISINVFFSFTWTFIKYFFNILKHLIKIHDGSALESFHINSIPIGKHIYDFVLRKYRIPSLNKFKFIHRVYISICIVYYFLIRDLITKQNIKSVVTLDNVYIEGVVFELSRSLNLKMYTGFDINLLTLHLFENELDYGKHCRTPDKAYLSDKFDNLSFRNKAKKFLDIRFSGDQNQHDAKRAFSSKNIRLNREELINKYNLSDGKIVLILPHIFCDAPHGYPSVIYKDYKYWLSDTLRVLNNNKEINIIIKEHPSANLYNEDGYLEDLIKTLNLDNIKLISNKINAKSLMETVDYCVTCGGTSGMEYAYHGVPVVLASSPPYGDFEFFNKAKNVNHYHELLNNIENLKKLTNKERVTAGNLLFLFFRHYGIDSKIAKLNFYHFNLGEENDLSYFFKNISKDNNVIESHLAITKSFNKMINNNYKNLYKD
tara:strand:+ start:1488 stop:3017 length:1530 start_codon:yes stop_codon:yes gene_type:complete